MAYGNYLASVSEEQIASVAGDPTRTLDARAVTLVSHLLAYWVKAQPLGSLLGEAIDGGRVLSDALWHPLRPPVYHPPDRVAALHQELSQAWQRAVAGPPVREIDWFRVEIERLLDVYRDAADHGACVVSALEPPVDEERASRVHVPLRTGPAGP